METSQKQTLLFGTDASTSSLVDSHVNPIHPQGNGLEKRTSAIYGRKCLEQFGKFNHVGLWAKMFSALLIGMEGWYSMRCKLTWKLKGTKSNRMYFQLWPSTPRTDGIEFGLLPTPAACDVEGAPKRPDQLSQSEGGNWYRTSDTTGTKFGAKLQDVAQMLPTPTLQDYTNSTFPPSQLNRGHVVGYLMREGISAGSQLNPRFVAEMMGYPPNWTELPFLSGETNP